MQHAAISESEHGNASPCSELVPSAATAAITSGSAREATTPPAWLELVATLPEETASVRDALSSSEASSSDDEEDDDEPDSRTSVTSAANALPARLGRLEVAAL